MNIKIRQISLHDLPLIVPFHKKAFPLLCKYFFCKLTKEKIKQLPNHMVEEKYYLEKKLLEEKNLNEH